MPKPRQPIQRRTPLKRSTPLKRTGYIQKTPRTPIPKISVKKKHSDAQYRISRLQALDEADHKCQGHTPMCTGIATTTHHSQGRGIYKTSKKFLKPLCWPCHDFYETHPEEAMAVGISTSRLGKTYFADLQKVKLGIDINE